MIKTDLSELLMNSVRMRIVQHLMHREEATTAQIQADLDDIPPATLYRHIRILRDSGLLKVVGENPIRGVSERIYTLNRERIRADGNVQGGLAEIEKVTNGMLWLLMNSYERYFKEIAHTLPETSQEAILERMGKDGYFMTTGVLLMTDEEFHVFCKRIGEAFAQVSNNTLKDGRKPRRITMMSSPEKTDSR